VAQETPPPREVPEAVGAVRTPEHPGQAPPDSAADEPTHGPEEVRS
jgi:hypothetical protein